MPDDSLQEMPMVSVVTVTYNSAKYIRQAIESILNSSFTNFELIVGDDCSTDNTWDIIKEFKDSRIVAYRNENNLKEYPNRNKAIQRAKGKYLIFIDGDDMIYPHGLEFMVKMLVANSDCGMAVMYPFLNWVFLPIKLSPYEFYVSNFFAKGFNDVAFANTIFDTGKLKKSSVLPTNFKAGDAYIRLEMAAIYPTLLIADQLTWWRETPGQASQLISKRAEAIIENFCMHRDLILKTNNPLNERERLLAIENELFKIKQIVVSSFKRFQLSRAFVILRALYREQIFFKVVLSRYTRKNLFDQFSPINPRTIKNTL